MCCHISISVTIRLFCSIYLNQQNSTAYRSFATKVGIVDKMYFKNQHIMSFLCLWLCANLCLAATGKPTESAKKCGDNSDCSNPTPVCCGKSGLGECRTETNCVGIPCLSSFECNDGKMWCCNNQCATSACFLPVWAVILVVMAVTIIISVVLIYVVLECCRRWPNVRRTLC